MEEYFSLLEFAKIAKVHPNTIRRGIASGKIQALNIGNGKKKTYRISSTEFGRMCSFDLREVIKKYGNEILKE